MGILLTWKEHAETADGLSHRITAAMRPPRLPALGSGGGGDMCKRDPESQSAGLHNFEENERQNSAISIETANDIIAAVRSARRRRNTGTRKVEARELSLDLGDALDIYRIFLADDRKPTTENVLKSLSSLVASVRNLQKAFGRYGSQSWTLLRRGAEEHLERTRTEFAKTTDRLAWLRTRFRRRKISQGRRATKIRAQIEKLQKKREDLDRVIIFFDDSAKAIWFRTMKGIDAILIWDCIAREFLSAEAKEDDPTGSANQWLIATEMPRIYKKHFGADFTFSRRAYSDGDYSAAELYGPALEFARGVCRAFDVRGRDGQLITDEAIDSHRRAKRPRGGHL